MSLGDVFESVEPRGKGRRVRVMSIAHGNGGSSFRHNPFAIVENVTTGRQSKIACKRLAEAWRWRPVPSAAPEGTAP